MVKSYNVQVRQQIRTSLLEPDMSDHVKLEQRMCFRLQRRLVYERCQNGTTADDLPGSLLSTMTSTEMETVMDQMDAEELEKMVKKLSMNEQLLNSEQVGRTLVHVHIRISYKILENRLKKSSFCEILAVGCITTGHVGLVGRHTGQEMQQVFSTRTESSEYHRPASVGKATKVGFCAVLNIYQLITSC